MKTNPFVEDEKVLHSLNELVSAKNYMEVLAGFIFRDFMGSAEKIANADAQEVLSYNEFLMLVGLWIKNQHNPSAANDPSILMRQTDELLKQYHTSLFFNNLEKRNQGQSIYDAFVNGQLFKEAFFYSSTAGYDTQYVEVLAKKYGADADWLLAHKGIILSELPAFFENIRRMINGRLQLVRISKRQIRPNEKVGVFLFTKSDLVGELSSGAAILEAFSFDLYAGLNSTYHDIADFNVFTERPIIGLTHEDYFIPLPYFVAEAMYESPYYWMFADKAYCAKAAKNRGNAAEDLVSDYISGFFGAGNVQRNVNIKIKKSTTLTDVDILAYSEDTAFIFQVKSKKLTQKSKKGDLEQITADFEKAVRIAKDQADLCIIALQNPEDYNFELPGGETYSPRKVSKFETVIVLLDQFPAMSHLTHILFGDELDTTPVAFGIFDLETLLAYLKTPGRFIDYIHRRTLYSKQYRAANELQYLGYYLKHGLEKLEENAFVYITPEYGQIMDAMQQQANIHEVKRDFPSKIGRNEPCPCGSGLKFKKCHG
ncbi:YecA family protein [Pedobacter endophyticus]|nr:SEC-C metal-binding domain-containing protein [Pedobacter endophyticus]